jgi:hypothetical protein
MISMIAGHVYSAPAVSIYVSFAMAMLDSALTKGELEITEERKRKKITIFENRYNEIISQYEVK